MDLEVVLEFHPGLWSVGGTTSPGVIVKQKAEGRRIRLVWERQSQHMVSDAFVAYKLER